jgi:hypothetical protein
MNTGTENAGTVLTQQERIIEPAGNATTSKKMIWTGRVLSALPSAMLIFSAIMKFLKPQAVVDGFNQIGIPDRLAFGLGALELACTLLYLIPQTAVLGAILLTGYLGGAILTHLRVGDAFVTHIVLGVIIWGGIYLRDSRLRALIPLRK